MKPNASKTETHAVATLNRLLRGELAATETYNQALTHISADTADLIENRDCHSNRAVALRRRIGELGGKPAEGSGAWGAFSKLVTGGAKVLGHKTVVAALEEGEDQGLADYRKALSEDLDEVSKHLIETDLLVAQVRTHGRMAKVQKATV